MLGHYELIIRFSSAPDPNFAADRTFFWICDTNYKLSTRPKKTNISITFEFCMVKNWLPVCRKKCFSLDFIHFQENGYKERLQSVSLSGQDFSVHGFSHKRTAEKVKDPFLLSNWHWHWLVSQFLLGICYTSGAISFIRMGQNFLYRWGPQWHYYPDTH